MNILGISAFYHDSAACLVSDGRIIAAAQEERFTRKKHDASFPRFAVDYCLREDGLSIQEVGLVGASAGPPVEDYTLTVAVVRKKCPKKARLFAQI